MNGNKLRLFCLQISYILWWLLSFFTLFILTIAAVETSIGLSLLLVSYRVRGNILIDNFNLLYF